jgi:hypothetical protein
MNPFILFRYGHVDGKAQKYKASLPCLTIIGFVIIDGSKIIFLLKEHSMKEGKVR